MNIICLLCFVGWLLSFGVWEFQILQEKVSFVPSVCMLTFSLAMILFR